MSYRERAAEEREGENDTIHCTFSAGVSRFHPDVYPRIFCLAASDLVHSRSGNRRACYHQIKVPPLDVTFSFLPSCLKASNPHYENSQVRLPTGHHLSAFDLLHRGHCPSTASAHQSACNNTK